MDPHPEKIPARLFDRFAVAFLAAVLAFTTGVIVYGLVFLVAFEIRAAIPPFAPVWWFSATMAILGFLLMDDWLAAIFGRVWHVLYTALRALFDAA